MTRTARRGVDNKRVNEATSWSELKKHNMGSASNGGTIFKSNTSFFIPI